MPRRIALCSVLLAVALSSSMGSTTAPFAVASEAELCFGQTPTIVGKPGKAVVGTEGPDVVVTNGAAGADTLGGDDLLCITGIPEDFLDIMWFKGGEGDDRITSSALDLAAMPSPDVDYPVISPGPGSDEVIGGPRSRPRVLRSVCEAKERAPGGP